MGSSNIPNHLAFIEHALQKREQSNQLRQIPEVQSKETPFIELKGGKKLLDFATNDYLGLSGSSTSAFLNSSISAASTSSRLLGGDSLALQGAENDIAHIFGGNHRCTIFPSTWQANASVIPALVGRNDLIITDKYAHNSIINAAKLSGTKFLRYKHNNLAELERVLSSNRADYKRCLVATESVFSMQGSMLEYEAFLEICGKYEAISFIDEAHAFGVYGEEGIGLVPKEYDVDIRVGALGKAAASNGGFVITSDLIRQYLANFADGLIYSTAISPLHASIISHQVSLLKKADEERAILSELIKKAQQLLAENGIIFDHKLSHIIPIAVGDDARCLQIKQALMNSGFWVAAIRPPTVPAGQACIRISLTARHTEKQLRHFISELCSAFKNA